MLKKPGKTTILFSTVLVICIALGTLYGAWCYTEGSAANRAELTVTSSENALIAVSVNKHLSVFQGESAICGTITNNMPVPLESINVYSDNPNCYFTYSPALPPALSSSNYTNLILHISASESPGLHTYPGTVLARWNGGEAEIKFEVPNILVNPTELGS